MVHSVCKCVSVSVCVRVCVRALRSNLKTFSETTVCVNVSASVPMPASVFGCAGVNKCVCECVCECVCVCVSLSAVSDSSNSNLKAIISNF